MGVKNSYSQGITCPYEVPDQREYYDAGGDLNKKKFYIANVRPIFRIEKKYI